MDNKDGIISFHTYFTLYQCGPSFHMIFNIAINMSGYCNSEINDFDRKLFLNTSLAFHINFLSRDEISQPFEKRIQMGYDFNNHVWERDF